MINPLKNVVGGFHLVEKTVLLLMSISHE